MFFFKRFLCFSVSLSLLFILPTQSVFAGKKGLGTAIGIGAGLLLLKGLSDDKKKKKKKRRSGGSRKSTGGGGTAYYHSQYDEQQEAVVNYNIQTERDIAAKKRKNLEAEKKRNVLLAIDGFIEELHSQHKKLRYNASNQTVAGLKPNQVTQGEIQNEVDYAYQTANLFLFDRFSGEIWTRDRLKVQIINEARKGLGPYFIGVGSKGPSMSDIKLLFQKSAKIVYGRALEISEIIGVSLSFDRFIRTIYENSDITPKGLMTIGADGYYERLLSGIINQVRREDFIASTHHLQSDHLGLERQFQYRFRARRSLYDCLAANYESLLKNKKPKAINVAHRGAKLDNSDKTQGGKVVNVVNATNYIPSVWQKTREHLEVSCSTLIKTLSGAAKAGQLNPVPARWISSMPQQRHQARPWEQDRSRPYGNGNQFGNPNFNQGNPNQQQGNFQQQPYQQQPYRQQPGNGYSQGNNYNPNQNNYNPNQNNNNQGMRYNTNSQAGYNSNSNYLPQNQNYNQGQQFRQPPQGYGQQQNGYPQYGNQNYQGNSYQNRQQGGYNNPGNRR